MYKQESVIPQKRNCQNCQLSDSNNLISPKRPTINYIRSQGTSFRKFAKLERATKCRKYPP